MPIIKFTPKKCNKLYCNKFYYDKCDCDNCKKLTSQNFNKKKIRINTYRLKCLEGLPAFYITKL
jgi:hypothetical protein